MNIQNLLARYDIQIRETKFKITILQKLEDNYHVNHVGDKLLKLRARKCFLEISKTFTQTYFGDCRNK